MKTSNIIISLILSVIWIYFAVADSRVVVTATVGNANHPPVILRINPSDDPRLLKTNRVQQYSAYFKDDEKDEITFTITSPDWYVYPTDWIVSTFDSASGAYISFTYASPSSVPAWNLSRITLTINDWSGTNVISKDLNNYVY
ncbi:MAG: hypothetical protein ACD_2C00105G0002 [uncultured bacterium (gcode 4)]|uniref:Uncharacterized protein n=1 Tax=uncultured bacterium (gcode 4) TaxID=1234023 RepID=K2H1N5_9BACT|nr:MAG: hypothetical protein ACD_2C00105G0002 [uncultured bacterium (gcode 4)]